MRVTSYRNRTIEAENATNNPITIREADDQDADAIYSMVVKLAAFLSEQDKVVSSVEHFRADTFPDPPGFHVLIAERDGEPVGMSLFFYTFSTWLGALGVYIQDLYVDEAARGEGLGARLVHETVRRARERGADHLRLAVDHRNTSAQGFYSKLGMRLRDDEHIYQADGEVFEKLADDGT